MQIDSNIVAVLVGLFFLLAPAAAIFLLFRLRRRNKEIDALDKAHADQVKAAETKLQKVQNELSSMEERFAAVLDIEKEIDKTQAEANRLSGQVEEVRRDYLSKREVYDRLRKEVAIFDERIAFAEWGAYEPHFEFSDSETFKEAIRAIREEQKALVQNKSAVVCYTEWTLEGSKAKGKTMTNRSIRLTLRAFNNECDAAIANTRWNNANAMIKRIENARTQIDKMNASNDIHITSELLRLKLTELRLTHEYREKLKQERDERSEAARLAREEKRLLQEAADAQREEEKYEQLLAKARQELGFVDTEEQDAKIKELERQLAEAHEKTERAQAMAEKTKSGFVYIISNLGSFGDGVVKIGLTRRLDPSDRVRELSDASVPFLFDTHAMIYSEEAPALEAALHQEFDDRRVNAANMRKEFFRAGLEEVELAVRQLAPDAEFFRDVEAQEFKETLAKRKERAEREEEAERHGFPLSI